MYDIRVIHHEEAKCWSVKVERTIKPLRCVAMCYVYSEQEAEEAKQRYEERYNKKARKVEEEWIE